MKKLFGGGLVLLALGLTACSSTFLVSKDGKGYYVGSGSDAAYEMLCESGDLARVLGDTKLSQSLKDDLYRFNCTPERSTPRVKELFSSLSPEERRDLRTAFRHNGYDINYLPC
jgi:hypothetical protein